MNWYFFVDAISNGSIDGALMRLTKVVLRNESIIDADKRLTGFAQHISSIIPEYAPN